MVAVIQMAITLGASVGGYLFDRGGYQSTFSVSAGLLIAAAKLVHSVIENTIHIGCSSEALEKTTFHNVRGAP